MKKRVHILVILVIAIVASFSCSPIVIDRMPCVSETRFVIVSEEYLRPWRGGPFEKITIDWYETSSDFEVAESWSETEGFFLVPCDSANEVSRIARHNFERFEKYRLRHNYDSATNTGRLELWDKSISDILNTEYDGFYIYWSNYTLGVETYSDIVLVNKELLRKRKFHLKLKEYDFCREKNNKRYLFERWRDRVYVD